MELKDLAGKHLLSGVDRLSESLEHWGSYANCDVINFVLDGVTYSVIEDPGDGYRSSMREIVVSERRVANNFPPVEVVGVYRDRRSYYVSDILEVYDTLSGRLVIEVGTENTDDWYPYYVANFNPENITPLKKEKE